MKVFIFYCTLILLKNIAWQKILKKFVIKIIHYDYQTIVVPIYAHMV